MFEAIFDVFSAWNALLYLLGGAIFSGIGCLILGYAAYVRIAERQYQAQIVGVRTDKPGSKMYWPLVAYTDTSGTRREVVANSGSSRIVGHTPGTKVTIFAAPSAPDAVMLEGDWWIVFVFGAIFAALGAPFLGLGFSMLHWTSGTALVVLALAAYGAWKLRGLVPLLVSARQNGFAETRKAFLTRRKDRSHPVALSAKQIDAAVAAQTKQLSYARPLLMAVGAALMIGGGFWLQSTAAFVAKALEAEGTVLRNEESDTSDASPSYHAVVAFTDQSGRKVVYRDTIGSSPPMYATGDKVKVLYSPAESSSAMIDRGIWKWLVPLVIVAAGLLFFTAGVWGALRARVTTRAPAAPTGATT
ncbi:MAG: DUF3592 domain-containing protein [Alphaproteobacteria bacterium]|nr:DUF3592 domain-containing protein [Alphaproteobacteria bacterium]